MNGVHDMGGMHGMGPIEHEKNEPVFHAPWEARAYALNRAMGAWGKWNIDASRHAKEVIPATEYLRMRYYEKWITGLVELMVEHGLVTRQEVARGKLRTIALDPGVFVFPDTNAHFLGEKPQHVYSVRFAARELWGEKAGRRDAVYIDLWDDHLEQA